jgi:hypothetical protein
VSISPEAKSFEIQRLKNVATAQDKYFFVHIIQKKLEFNKPATKELTRTSYKMRSSILTYFKDFYEYNRLNISLPNVEKNGSDEYFVDMTKLVHVLLRDNKHSREEEESNFYLEGHNDVYIGNDVEDHLEHYFDQDLFIFKEEVQMVQGGKILQGLREKIEKDTSIVCSGIIIFFIIGYLFIFI